MAVKFRLPDGSATDLLGQTSPRFPTDDPEVFVALTEATEKPLTLPLFLARHPGVLPSVVASARAKAISSPVSFAEVTFYPIHAYGWLDADGTRTWVRYIFRATATKADRLDGGFSGRDQLGEEMAARLERGPVTHEVWVQVAGAGHDPHRATSVWSGARELLAGRIVVTAPVDDPEGGPMTQHADRLRPDPRRRRHRALRRPDPALPAAAPTRSPCPGGPAPPPSLSSVKTLVIGTGGREHALARALAARPRRHRGARAPGNPGIAAVATLHDVDPLDGPAVAALAASLGVDLVVVGPEAPLVAGVADAVRAAGIAAFGPSAMAARLEGSKAFAKEVMAAAGVPTARAFVCTHRRGGRGRAGRARRAVRREGRRPGRRQGRGRHRVARGGAGPRPGRLRGRRAGRDRGVPRRPRGLAVRDHRRQRPSTRCSRPRTSSGSSTATRDPTPAAWAPTRRCRGRRPDLVDEVLATVLQPTVDELARRGTPFSGLLYAGLALTSRGMRVVEFNARFGDPETQPLLALLESPLGELLMASATGTLADAAAAGLRRRRRGRRGDGQPRLPGLVVVRRRDRRHRRRRGARRRARHPRRARRCATATWSPPAAGCSPWSAPAPTSRRPAPRRTPASPRSPSTVPSTGPTSQRRGSLPGAP